MDIIAHGLWTAAAAKALNRRRASRVANQEPRIKWSLNVWLATFWGIFPDLFAFTIPFAWIASGILFGNLHLSDIPRPHQIEPPTAGTFWVIHLAKQLYNISHSGLVFATAFLLVWLVGRFVLPPSFRLQRAPWEMGGWLLHVLIDIPTHSYQFYPTPIFWPISSWKFVYGFSWSVPWFMILNYSALAIVYYLLWRKKKKLPHQQN